MGVLAFLETTAQRLQPEVYGHNPSKGKPMHPWLPFGIVKKASTPSLDVSTQKK
jgi:hypothetical protein